MGLEARAAQLLDGNTCLPAGWAIPWSPSRPGIDSVRLLESSGTGRRRLAQPPTARVGGCDERYVSYSPLGSGWHGCLGRLTC